jgi:uncharacterized protein (DUF427 family)
MSEGHRITVSPTTQHVEVRIAGEKIAVSDQPVLLQETGLPTRYYFRPEDVRTELLRPTTRETTCPFKGQASYWSLEIGGEVHDDIVWAYEAPIPEVADIAGLLCFYNERVDLTVDGEAVGRPVTPFSPVAR